MTRWPGISQFDLTDRVALVTGGSKGLGEAIAAGLASAGAKVAVVSRHADEAVAAASRIASAGLYALNWTVMIRDSRACSTTVADASRGAGLEQPATRCLS